MTNNEDHEHYPFGKYWKIMSLRVIFYQINTDLIMNKNMTIRMIMIMIMIIILILILILNITITIIHITNGNTLIFGEGETPKNKFS